MVATVHWAVGLEAVGLEAVGLAPGVCHSAAVLCHVRGMWMPVPSVNTAAGLWGNIWGPVRQGGVVCCSMLPRNWSVWNE